MAHKETRKAEIKGCGSGGSSAKGFLDLVSMQLEITDAKDVGRPVQALMTPDQARHWAALLTKMADLVDARHKPAACVVVGCQNTPEEGSAYCAEDRAGLRTNPERYA
jgi:hypothetical protein